jgi:hypothetical protein
MKARRLVLAALVIGLTLGLAGMASAATISCGQCHGAYTNNTDGTSTLIPGTPAYEDTKTPQAGDICDNNGRGLHGVHMNYSSVSYGRRNATTRGNCNYCHNAHIHENGFVEFSGMVATARQKTGSAGKLSVSGTGIDANGLDIMTMDGNATCTKACHSGTTGSNPAPWGNYTSSSMKLSCSSCHDDVVDKNLSGAHAAHLNSAITVNGGLMGAAGNAGCVNCHPDNRNDLWSGGRADDGTKKAYPHASDGTNVVSDNASVNAGISITRGAGATDTCANACHRNKTASWDGGSLDCDSCHYQSATPTAAGNDAAAVSLPGGHSKHFGTGAEGITCGSCHPAVTDLSHVGSLPVGSTAAALLPGLNWNGTTCNDGTCHISQSPVWGTTGAGCTGTLRTRWCCMPDPLRR